MLVDQEPVVSVTVVNGIVVSDVVTEVPAVLIPLNAIVGPPARVSGDCTL